MPERSKNSQILVEDVHKYKDWNLAVYIGLVEAPIDKENLIWGRKIQDQMFMDSIKFYWRFNWIYEGFDCKKNLFWSQFGL
jgi:hypothetical protein